MATTEIRLWPGVPDLRALGAQCFEDLMGLTGELEGEAQGDVRARAGGLGVLRYPLPGTVHAPGEKPARPRGAGTGFVDLYRWTGGAWSERFATRFKAPRSESFAAHAWNLICHLREAGVGTAEPLAMGQENSAVFASRSFLVTRALDPMLSLPEYMEQDPGPGERRHLAHALGLLLLRVQQAGVELPLLKAAALFVARTSGKGCAIEKIQRTQAGEPAVSQSPVPGMKTGELPELALAEFHGGRLHGQLSLETRVEHLDHLARNSSVHDYFSPRDLMRIARQAFGRNLDRDARRRALRRLIKSTLAP